MICRIDFDYPVGSSREKLQWCYLVISGAIKNVYSAKQKIVVSIHIFWLEGQTEVSYLVLYFQGSLPLVIMFELASVNTPNQAPMEDADIEQIGQTLGVDICIKGKRMDGRKQIIIRGQERNAGMMINYLLI